MTHHEKDAFKADAVEINPLSWAVRKVSQGGLGPGGLMSCYAHRLGMRTCAPFGAPNGARECQ
jgi:hypothetical protein